MRKRIAEYGFRIGELRKGTLNKITDVPGVRVGHTTVDDATHKTGVTVILPCPENPYVDKLVAAVDVLNGYGKTLGLMHIEEIGLLETPIALTNTLNVGLVHDAIVGHMANRCKEENVEFVTINPVVGECNDSFFSDITDRVVRAEHVEAAIANARVDFEEGAIGGGRGLSCHQLKGGIGSASRIIELDGREYTLGVLVQSNHGRLCDLVIEGLPIGAYAEDAGYEPDRGSILTIVATDLPVSDRQLKRILRRVGVGLARLGSFTGHGSGEIMIGFTTANRVRLDEKRAVVEQRILNEEKIDQAFRAVAYATEEAVLNSMCMAEPLSSFRGKRRESLSTILDKYFEEKRG